MQYLFLITISESLGFSLGQSFARLISRFISNNRIVILLLVTRPCFINVMRRSIPSLMYVVFIPMYRISTLNFRGPNVKYSRFIKFKHILNKSHARLSRTINLTPGFGICYGYGLHILTSFAGISNTYIALRSLFFLMLSYACL